MYTEIHIKADELDESFIKSIQAIFKKKRISIIVEEDLNDTEYLLSTNANRKHLQESIASEPVVKYSLNELKAHSKKLVKKGKKSNNR